jgi:hypothetical protein
MVTHSTDLIHVYNRAKDGNFQTWSQKNIFQNNSSAFSKIKYGEAEISVPPSWYAWAEENSNVLSLKISKLPEAIDSHGVIVFLKDREWQEESLKTAMAKMGSADKNLKLSIEKWNGREWLVSKESKVDEIKISVRTITDVHKFKWAQAEGPKSSESELVATLKSLTIK